MRLLRVAAGTLSFSLGDSVIEKSRVKPIMGQHEFYETKCLLQSPAAWPFTEAG